MQWNWETLGIILNSNLLRYLKLPCRASHNMGIICLSWDTIVNELKLLTVATVLHLLSTFLSAMDLIFLSIFSLTTWKEHWSSSQNVIFFFSMAMCCYEKPLFSSVKRAIKKDDRSSEQHTTGENLMYCRSSSSSLMSFLVPSLYNSLVSVLIDPLPSLSLRLRDIHRAPPLVSWYHSWCLWNTTNALLLETLWCCIETGILVYCSLLKYCVSECLWNKSYSNVVTRCIDRCQ